VLRTLFVRLWNDEAGAVLSTEYLMLASVLSAGGVAGMVEMRDAVTDEYREAGRDVRELRRNHMPQPAQGTSAGATKSQMTNGPPVGLSTGQYAVQTSAPSCCAP
jgi:hypothetical protein